MSLRKPGLSVRTNYRLTGNLVDIDALNSMIILESYRDSFSDFITVSMGGHGFPSILWIAGKSAISGAIDATCAHQMMPTQSFSGSIGWIHVYESNEHMTGTARIIYGALIASR